MCLMPWVLPFLVRQDLRKREGMDDECCKDMLTSVFCCPCSLAQTAKAAEEAAAADTAVDGPGTANAAVHMPNNAAVHVPLVTQQPQQLRW